MSDTDTDIAPNTISRRADGWSAANQRAFLEAIAEGHGADAAAARVGLSATSAYAFRRTTKGTTFALGWRAATLVAREVVAETLMVRALHGQADTYTRADGSIVTRHRHDNRLAASLLARLDRQVEGAADADLHAARLVAQDFDSYLDLVGRDDGAARAGLLLARHSTRIAAALARAAVDDVAAHDLAPLYALAAADLFARTGVTTTADLSIADLDPARRAEWSAGQWTRAEAAGMVTFAAPSFAAPSFAAPSADDDRTELDDDDDGADDAPPSQHSQHSPGEEAVWWDDDVEEWRTHFPPADDFDGEEHGDPGTPDYERTLSTREEAAMGTPPGHCSPAEVAALAQARDLFFAPHGEPRPPVADAPEPSPLRDVGVSPIYDTGIS
ncbi:hypothetical protein ASE95_01570 [Sphingomonas sp. Leaf231]|uniref:hypothetical protein n=1 Tax=Sphingomonas sp. Leaf231 TaxID=1736301 RepID=UPI0006F7D5A3|nr:hypothetical protein [Sphingomonas sp. Leaf231]KQN93650.1 hypothetical protein ASE95_01570 [Sphingomonas sp. Leaf231]